MLKNWKLTIKLISPLAVEPPALDALLMWEMAMRLGIHNEGVKLTRNNKLQEVVRVPIPLCEYDIGDTTVYQCSDPIYKVKHEYHEHIAKRFDTDKNALMLHPTERKALLIASGPFKMRFNPVRTMIVPEIVYFFRGDRHEVNKLLKKIIAIGKHRNIGYGFIGSYHFDEMESNYSIFYNCESGRVLMKTIPCIEESVSGCYKSFGACKPPYWHPDNYMEVLKPC